MRDDVTNGVVAIFKRDPEIAVGNTVKIFEILFPNRFILMIFRLDGAFDFRRSRRALPVERPARREMLQGESQRTDDQQQRQGKDEAFKKIHDSVEGREP